MLFRSYPDQILARLVFDGFFVSAAGSVKIYSSPAAGSRRTVPDRGLHPVGRGTCAVRLMRQRTCIWFARHRACEGRPFAASVIGSPESRQDHVRSDRPLRCRSLEHDLSKKSCGRPSTGSSVRWTRFHDRRCHGAGHGSGGRYALTTRRQAEVREATGARVARCIMQAEPGGRCEPQAAAATLRGRRTGWVIAPPPPGPGEP